MKPSRSIFVATLTAIVASTLIFLGALLSDFFDVSSFGIFEGAAHAQADPVAPPATYPNVGVDAGVYNGGQAAVPWDINLIDHYRYFGFPERSKGYKPQQPIKYSHVLHVKENQIDCQFCHWSVAKASFAAIPEVESCMGCHATLVNTERTQKSEEIKKLKQYWADGKPIPWVKVHVMPEYVKFNHKRHVKGGVACQECHGQVPEMEEVERVSSMKMGWCIDCHRQRGTSIDCAVCHG